MNTQRCGTYLEYAMTLNTLFFSVPWLTNSLYHSAIICKILFFFFFFNDPPTPEISPLSLHAPLPISIKRPMRGTPAAAWMPFTETGRRPGTKTAGTWMTSARGRVHQLVRRHVDIV